MLGIAVLIYVAVSIIGVIVCVVAGIDPVERMFRDFDRALRQITGKS